MRIPFKALREKRNLGLPRRPLPRFALKSLLALLTLACLWCGYYASQAHSRRRAITQVAERGGATWQQGQITVSMKAIPDSGRSWLSRCYEDALCRLFGAALRKDVVAVDLSEANPSERDILSLKPLDELQWLTATGPEIDDAAARHIGSFKHLRWLDVSGTKLSVKGVRKMEGLHSLQWLNVSQTRVLEADLNAIQSMFPNAKIGFSSSPDVAATPPSVSSSFEPSSRQRTLWSKLKANPYSSAALKQYIDAIGPSTALNFPQWYIYAVYRAKRSGMDPLLVIEVYDGTRISFNLGCLLVFDADGKLLREMPRERVHWTLRGSRPQSNWLHSDTARILGDQQAAAKQQLLELTDLTGDGFDEIPTQRWDNVIASTNVQGESTSIYTSASTDIPCLFCIAFPSRAPSDVLVDLGGMDRQLSYRDVKLHALFLRTPCYTATPTGTTVLGRLPQRTLATFYWSEEAGAFLGPTDGPQNAWHVYRR